VSKKSGNSKQPEVRNGHIASNKRARHDYTLTDKFEAGMVLLGSEVKTLRQGRAQITDGYISVDDNGEVWIENVSIPPYNHAASNNFVNHTDRRKRKLLLNRVEISKIHKSVEQKSMTAVPLNLYFSKGKAKLEFALAKGKHTYDKRDALKERDISRETAREVKGWRG
jgi:SsrA-binding protein